MPVTSARSGPVALVAGCAVLAACGSGATPGFSGPDAGHDGDLDGKASDGPVFVRDAGKDSGESDPTTCAEAASIHSYVGCDFWPTVTANSVWSIFDFAAVAANAGASTAHITVTGPNGTNQVATVPPGQLTTIYLPWVPALKGPDIGDECDSVPSASSVLARASAYHLVSSVPIIVYQFNALEYLGQGGPPGKDWSACPGSQPGSDCQSTTGLEGCYSFTNDASLLLPSTALTGNYRVTGHGGWGVAMIGAFVTITGTVDNTTVNFKVSRGGVISAGAGVPVTRGGDTYTFTLGAGDVAELMSDTSDISDLSGSLINATQPVQVITGVPCVGVPDDETCDHVEESNFPAETLGTDYVVAEPTGPHGVIVGHEVRLYGNFDDTTLSYPAGAPDGCPTKIDAGQVVDCGIVAQDFEVKGDHSFAVAAFTQSAAVVDPSDKPPQQMGDPDQSVAAPVAQYRTKYVFLAPTDYEENFVVVVEPTGTTVTLDGRVATASPAAVGATGYSVQRLPLDAGQGGAHLLMATRPVGIQVMGYGSYTSYQYPGGLALERISAPPIK
jgi:hypothetical protein